MKRRDAIKGLSVLPVAGAVAGSALPMDYAGLTSCTFLGKTEFIQGTGHTYIHQCCRDIYFYVRLPDA